MKILIILIVVLLLAGALYNILKHQTLTKLNNSFQQEDYKQVQQLLNKPITKWLLNDFTYQQFAFNLAILTKDCPQAFTLLQQLKQLTNNNDELTNLLLVAFNFFTANQQKEYAKAVLTDIESLDNPQFILEAQRVYRITIEKSDIDLEPLLKELDQLDDQQKGVNEFLISLIYQNNNDLSKAQHYQTLSQKHLQQ